MAQDIELSVTITYRGPKAKIATADEAAAIIRQDLTALGKVHPKRVNMSLVSPGMVRFFWVCPRKSTIANQIRPLDTYANRPNQVQQELLDTLFIERIVVREQPAGNTPGKTPRSNSGSSSAVLDVLHWRPPDGASSSGSVRRSESVASVSSSRPRGESVVSTSGAKLSWDRPSEPQVKMEPRDIPIPPLFSQSRSRGADRPIDVDAYAYRHTPSASSSVTASPQKSSYERTKEGLQNELAEVRRREREILQQLKAMGVNVNTNVASVGEEQLQNDAARVRGLERELEEERARRREAEAFVADVRRELRAPFVVPALLDAFKDISRLTNETL